MSVRADVVGRSGQATPYINNKYQTQNTKELFDMLKPTQTGEIKQDASKALEKPAQQVIEKIKQEFVSNQANLASAGLKKLLDTARFINNTAGMPIINDKELQKLMLKPEMLLKELNMQHKGASIFKGELFDGLRDLLKTKFPTAETQEKVKDSVVNFLRQYANTYMKAQKLEHEQSKPLDAQQVAAKEQPQATTTKGQDPKVQEASKQTDQKSVEQARAETKEGATTTKNNEAGFKRAETLLQKSVDTLTTNLREFGMDKMAMRLENIKQELPNLVLNQALDNRTALENTSMDKMLDMILSKLDESAGHESIKVYGEQFVRGLFNTNAMNQPILHFVLPVLYEDMNVFAEMWIDPEAEGREEQNGKNQGKSTRVFLTIDLEGAGRAELDIMLTGNKLFTGLYYPPELEEAFTSAKQYISAVTQEAGFGVGDINIEPLQGARQLDSVIGKPIERRMTLNAKA